MAALNFSIAPSEVLRFHDALICLAKFSESVSIEAEYDLLRLSALNTTRTGYAAFVFDADKFFSQYAFRISKAGSKNSEPSSNRFSCQIYLKALLSVFKGRLSDSRDRETAIERCDVELHDGADEGECRLIIRMICGQGVIKSYKLTYEPANVQHAVFDRMRSRNQWTIESKLLREIIDHFSPSAEQLDIYPDNGKAIYTSFTTKITDGKEILKQPVYTSVAIETKDFEEFLVEENLHVAINVKDFKAAVIHADTLKAAMTARYTSACRPLQLAYESEGFACEFILMTRGEVEEGDIESNRSRPATQLSAKPVTRPASRPAVKALIGKSTTSQTKATAEPPRASGSIRNQEAPPTAPHKPSVDIDSLFVPADDDRQWDEANYEEDTEDRLGWDATADQEAFNASFGRRLQEIDPLSRSNRAQTTTQNEEPGIPPTQRISQIRGLGLFD